MMTKALATKSSEPTALDDICSHIHADRWPQEKRFQLIRTFTNLSPQNSQPHSNKPGARLSVYSFDETMFQEVLPDPSANSHFDLNRRKRVKVLRNSRA
jgi:hypothetical protein